MTTVVLEHLQHANSGSPDLTVGPDGNIGIGGVAAPSANLEINPTGSDGELKITSDANGGNNMRLIQGYNSYINASNNVYISAGGNTDMFNLVNGKVRIGAAGTGNELLNVTVAGRGGIQVGSTTGEGAYIVLDGPNNGDGSGGDYAYIEHDSTGKLKINVGNSSNSVGNRMTIWPEGYTQIPYQPSFQAYKISHLAISGSGQVEAGDWSTSFVSGGHNTGGHFNTTNGRFTVPIAGRYKFDANIMHGITSGDYQIWICVNGNTNNCIRSNSMQSSGGNWKQTTVTGLLNLQANDYISIFVRSSQSETYAMYGSSTGAFTTCNGYLLG